MAWGDLTIVAGYLGALLCAAACLGWLVGAARVRREKNRGRL
jgi:hypothetical protein